jgi:hypothetical protein
MWKEAVLVYLRRYLMKTLELWTLYSVVWLEGQEEWTEIGHKICRFFNSTAYKNHLLCLIIIG